MAKVNSESVVRPVTEMLADLQVTLGNELLQHEQLIKHLDAKADARHAEMMGLLNAVAGALAHMANGQEGHVDLGRILGRKRIVLTVV